MYNNMRKIYTAGIEAVKPAQLIRQALQVDINASTLHINGGRQYNLKSKVCVIGFGKAVFGMTVALHSLLGDYIKRAIVSVPVGTIQQATQANSIGVQSLLNDRRVSIFEGAANNLPDVVAERAAKEILQLAKESTKDDLIIALVSGGGSALLPLPVHGVSLQEKRKTIELLSKAGATINELNAIRQCISQVKGGKLAAEAYPAQLLGLILSDIVNDPLEHIASGPTIPQSLDYPLVQNVMGKYAALDIPESVMKHTSGLLQSSPPNGYSDSEHVCNVLIGNNITATTVAAEEAKRCGYEPIVWSHAIQGEARDIGQFYATIADRLINNRNGFDDFLSEMRRHLTFLSVSIPDDDIVVLSHKLVSTATDNLCLISGGEPTVTTVQACGVGGRNQELALSFAKHSYGFGLGLKSKSQGRLLFCSIGSDGQDGPTDTAGAVVDCECWGNALEQGLDPEAALRSNDSYTFFSVLSNGAHHIKTGLTGTNVMDFHILMIDKHIHTTQ